ncbi:cytochrome P450 [Amycolatopsis sp. A1MSW2902]|uniref:cytochrome P450 n=1 Tax=Amycolatopsis sp. A1MSW2902 TaxID=687413 RepID=UPI00307DB3E5
METRRPALVDRFRPVDLERDWDTLRRDAPVARVPCADGEAWLLSRHEDVRFVLSSKDFAVTPLTVAPSEGTNNSIFQDPPGHTRLRRLISPAFTVRRTEQLRPLVQAGADRLVAATTTLSAPFDLMAAVAYPLAMDAISEVVGIPVAGRETFLRLAGAILVPDENEEPDVIVGHAKALDDYIHEIIEDRRRRGGGGQDVLGVLQAALGEDALSDDEMAQLVLGLPIAGYVSTTTALALGMRYLVDGGWLPRLRAEPGLVAPFVEELLRLQSGDNGESMPRYATADVTVGTTRIAKGDMVIAPLIAANRDDSAFPDPQIFDPSRRTDPHLAFGAGIHRCVGAPLARMELQCAVRALMTVDADLTIETDPADMRWRSNLFGDAFPEELMLRWADEGSGHGAD